VKKVPAKKSAPKTAGIKANQRYSVLYDDGQYYDVTCTAVKNGMATIVYDDDTIDTVSVHDLEAPLVPNVPARYEMLGRLVQHTASGNLRSLFIAGNPGIGKTFTVTEVLEANGYSEEVDYITVSGHSTPFSLYKTLFDNNGKIIVFDDCDSVFGTEIGANILKAVLDTTGKRQVSWKSNERTLADYPDTFQFTGQVIFLSNLELDDVPGAILSRSVMVDLWLGNDEIIDLMELLAPSIAEKAGATEKNALDVIGLIRKYRNNIDMLSLRTLVLGLSTLVSTNDMELVRYQILRNSAGRN
jgi:hypothetical protein